MLIKNFKNFYFYRKNFYAKKFYFKKTNVLRFIDENLYEILNVDKESKPEEIKIAYRKLIENFDAKNLNFEEIDPKEESKLKLIELAYETLSNEMTREMYDAVIDGYRSMYGVKYRKEFYKKFYGIDIDNDNENCEDNFNNFNKKSDGTFKGNFNFKDFGKSEKDDFSYSDNFTYKENIKKAEDIEVI